MFCVRQPARGANLDALTSVHASVGPPAYFRRPSLDKSSIGVREPLAPAWRRPSRAIANPIERDVVNEARRASAAKTRESFQAMTT
jgi:hypothetical protein